MKCVNLNHTSTWVLTTAYAFVTYTPYQDTTHDLLPIKFSQRSSTLPKKQVILSIFFFIYYFSTDKFFPLCAIFFSTTCTSQNLLPSHFPDFCFEKTLLNLLQYCLCFMFCFLGPEARGIVILLPGIKPAPLALEDKVLITASPGKPPIFLIFYHKILKREVWMAEVRRGQILRIFRR